MKMIRFILVLIFFTVFIQIGLVMNRRDTSVLPCEIKEKNLQQKYIGSGFLVAGGLGNQIWRFASLFGIGKSIGRSPYFASIVFQNEYTNNFSKLMNLTEISDIFPSMYKEIQIKNPCPVQIKKVNFAEDCCKFDDPLKLTNIPEQYVEIKGDYLLSYKFFHPYRNDIKKVLECGSNIMKKVNGFAKSLFDRDNSIKFCVHIRRGDFLEDIMLESEKYFTDPAIYYVGKHLLSTEKKNISLVLLGKDDSFIQSLNFQRKMFHEVYKAELKNRGEDLCFGINYCDAMLLTASGSTFGWWMAYLMKSNGPVFYNSQVTDYSNHSKDIHDFDLFLPEWTGLTLKNGKVQKESKWWHERNNVLPDLPSKDLQM